MSNHISVNAMYTHIGDDASTAAKNIRRAGEDMYAALRQLVGSGGLEGEGIQVALEQSHQRWNSACDSFALAEQKFADQAHETYMRTLALDARLGAQI